MENAVSTPVAEAQLSWAVSPFGNLIVYQPTNTPVPQEHELHICIPASLPIPTTIHVGIV